MTIVTTQLAFDLGQTEEPPRRPAVARNVPPGAERLLKAPIVRGLDEAALLSAAGLALELDEAARR